MKITKRQLRRIIREEKARIIAEQYPDLMLDEADGTTEKYDDDSALKGDQDELPDALQKGIIDKTVKDREKESVEESLIKITKRQLRRIIKEEKAKVLAESMPGVDKQVRELWDDEEDPKRDDLMGALQKEWGLKNVKTTEEFDGTPGGIWLSGESDVPVSDSGLPMYDYYMDMDPYNFGIHPDFEDFVIDKFGFAPEWNDPGTLMLWPL